MAMWFDIVWWGYVALWAGSLVHCLAKRQFYPIFGPGWGTKVFWLVTFVFMNPLLTLLYLIFGVLFSRVHRSVPKASSGGASVCLVLTMLIIGLFELPRSPEPAKEVSIVRHGQESPKRDGFKARLGALGSSNSITTATSSGNSGHARFCAGSVVIQNRTNHLLIDKVCRMIQARIAEMPYVREVQYWPAQAQRTGPLSRGDIFIVVEAPKLSEKNFGIKRTVEADISCHVATEPLEKSQHSYYGYSPPVMRFSMNSHLRHRSVFKGFETSKARYQQQSQDMAEQLIGAMAKQFDTWIEKHGLLPGLPEYLYTVEPNTVTFPFLEERNAALLYHSGGLLIEGRAFWLYEDERSNVEAFREVRDSLQAHGWQGGYQLDRERKEKRTIQSFTLQRDNERLQVFRTRGRSDAGGIVYGDSEPLEKKLPIAVEYLALLPDERVNELLTRFFRSDANIEAKLVFQDFSSDDNLTQVLVDSVESARIKTMDGYLFVGQFYAGRDEMDKAKDALMMARALGRADRQHNPAANEIKALAKKIGDASLATSEMPVDVYERAGFVDLADVNDSCVYERAVGEPLLFYSIGTGSDQGRIKTIAITITKVAGADDQYEVTTVQKTKGSSSVGTRTLAQVVFFNDPRVEGKTFHLQTEQLQGDKFKLTFRTGRDHLNR